MQGRKVTGIRSPPTRGRHSTLKKYRIGVIVGAFVAAITIPMALASSPATATNTGGCVTTTHGDTKGVTTVPAAAVENQSDGIKMSTPDNPAKVSWQSDAFEVSLKDVKDLSYSTYKYDTAAPAALPAYKLYLKMLNGDTATIVYEPYYQIPGNPAKGQWKTWNVEDGKWWTSSTKVVGMTPEGGGSYANNKTLGYIAEKNPGVKVVAFGWGQGTYNAGAVTKLNNVKFSTKYKCSEHKWDCTASPSPSKSSASPSASVTATVTPTTQPTTMPPTTPGITVSATPVSGSLPVTGPGTGGVAIAGGVLFLIGVAVVLVARKRKTDEPQFVVE